MATTQPLMDADTFLARPPTRLREELIDGRLFVMNQPILRHQAVVVQLVVALKRWIDEGGGQGLVVGSVATRVSEDTVLVPDVLWYAQLGRTEWSASAQVQPPDLVVEVRSPSTWHRDLGLKSQRYAGWGVRELWLVDPDARTVLVRRRAAPTATDFDHALEFGCEDTLASPMLPGFDLPVRDLFDREHQK